MLAIIERYVHFALAPGIEQALSLGIFANHIDGRSVGYAAHNLAPGLAAIMRAINMRAKIVQPERVDGCIGSVFVEVTSIDDRYLLPRGQLRRRHIGPMRSAVRC